MSEDIEGVRVHHAGSAEVSYLEQRQRSDAQKHQDTILDKAAEHGEQALDHLNKALDWLSVVAQSEASKHRAMPIYAQQLVDAIAELKRIRQ